MVRACNIHMQLTAVPTQRHQRYKIPLFCTMRRGARVRFAPNSSLSMSAESFNAQAQPDLRPL
jgi:hypothetical protein